MPMDGNVPVWHNFHMGFHQDVQVIEEIVQGRDPAFASVPVAARMGALETLHKSANIADKDSFLLAAMRVVALAGNGHSRVIPNLAIRVAPHRIILRDGRPALVVKGDPVPIVTVNGIATERLITAWAGLLAGTPTRRRMLSGIMMAWPAALRVAGADDDALRYDLEGGGRVVCAAQDLVDASSLFPVSDNGFLDPDIDDYALASDAMVAWHDGLWRIRIARLKDADTADFSAIVQTIQTRPDAGLIVDLRGNTGGDYTKAWALIDWLATDWRGARCAVLVNGYTFSAAIVVAVLLKHRLGARAQLFGSEVGDDLAFHAEGDTAQLKQSGGLFRYSSAWHDWQTGQPDATTPEYIAKEMVGIGSMDIAPIAEALQLQTARAFVQED